MLGLAYYKTKQFEKALSNMELAISGGVKNAELHYFKGNILYDKEEYRQAVNDFQKAEEGGISEGDLYAKMGNAFLNWEISANQLSN